MRFTLQRYQRYCSNLPMCKSILWIKYNLAANDGRKCFSIQIYGSLSLSLSLSHTHTRLFLAIKRLRSTYLSLFRISPLITNAAHKHTKIHPISYTDFKPPHDLVLSLSHSLALGHKHMSEWRDDGREGVGSGFSVKDFCQSVENQKFKKIVFKKTWQKQIGARALTCSNERTSPKFGF